MKISQVKKTYSFELQQKLKKEYLKADELDYRIRNFFDDICDDGIYTRYYPKNKPKWRITFIPFLLFVIIITLSGWIKWFFTGSAVFDSKSFVVKKMIAWDRYCRFDIL
jgi:hypothetical protein